MTERQTLLLKNSWRHALINQAESERIFFTRLYQAAPHFSERLQRHVQRFINSLTFIITKLDHADDIVLEMYDMARRLTAHGATPDHFVITGECLIRTLKEINGQAWTKETEEAWFGVYGLFCSASTESTSKEKQLKLEK
jgi:hemoglobin-like flavoprotein